MLTSIRDLFYVYFLSYYSSFGFFVYNDTPITRKTWNNEQDDNERQKDTQHLVLTDR